MAISHAPRAEKSAASIVERFTGKAPWSALAGCPRIPRSAAITVLLLAGTKTHCPGSTVPTSSKALRRATIFLTGEPIYGRRRDRNIARVSESASSYLTRDGVNFLAALSTHGWFTQSVYDDASLQWFKDGFGVDSHEFPLDHERRSSRVKTPNLKMIVLRQEDTSQHKEAETNWRLAGNNIAVLR
jgi:hypothetical protein